MRARRKRSIRPLHARRILVTRARGQAAGLTRLLRRQGATVSEIPAIEIRPPRSYRQLDSALRQAEKYDWLMLTSVNGAHAFFARLKKLKIPLSGLRHLRVAAIGPATRTEIERHGLAVHVVPREYVAESAVRALRSRVKGKRVLLVRARVARDLIPAELRKVAAEVRVCEAYETAIPRGSRPRLLRLLADPQRRPHAITFTSSSTACNFVQMLGEEKTYCGLLDGVRFASIGPVTSATLRELRLPVHIQARRYDMQGLAEAIALYFLRG